MSVLKIRDENDQWTSIPTIKGDTGEAAGFGTVSATVDANHGTPSVTVTTSGDDTAKNFAFDFKNLQPAPYDDSELQADFAVLQGQFDTAVAAVTTDTEVTDIRVGADGITDTTAGASVRRQFTDLKSDIDNITNKSVKALTPIAINALLNNSKIYFDSAGRSIYFPIKGGSKYTVKVTGSFNRSAIGVCDSIAAGTSVNVIENRGAASYTSQTYEYISDGSYNYVFIMLAYSDSSYSVNAEVIEEAGYSETEFYVNGIEVLQPSQADIVTDGQYRKIALYEESTLVVNNSMVSDAVVGKSIFVPMESGITYDITITGIYNRYIVGLCNSKALNTPVTVLQNEGSLYTQTSIKRNYRYKSNGTHAYLIVYYNYDGDSTASNIVISAIAERIIPDGLTVSGIPIYTQNDAKQIFASSKYFRAKDGDNLVATSSGVYALYDALVSAYPQYVSKNTLTKDAFTNYEYVFGTPDYNTSGQRNRDSVINKPLILLTSGVHGYERSAVMSTYSLLKAMCENAYPLNEILQKCCIRVLPIVCPWGYDNNRRWNENGVNINRNFDANWQLGGQPFEDNYSGASPASELETQLVQDWVDEYASEAVAIIDFHNSGFPEEVSYVGGANSLAGMADLKKGYRLGIDDAIGYWVSERAMSDTSLIYGYTGQMYIDGSCQKYASLKGKPSVTLETSWNQNGTGKHSAETIGVGAESLSVLLIGILDKLI